MEEPHIESIPAEPAKALPPKRRFRWDRLILWINYSFILFLLFSYLAPYVSPSVFWPLAFFGISYPVFLIFNLLFVLYWALRFQRRFLYSLLAIFLGFQTLFAYVQINLHKTPDAVLHCKYPLKIMSFNTKLFDLYNWSHNMETRSRIFDMLKSESSDIICMQEFYNSDKGHFRNLDTLVKLQKAKYSHTEYMVTLRGTDHWGMATFSSYPIVNRGMIDFNTRGNNSCIYTDIQIGTDTIRVYNVHLQSMHFSDTDYKFIESLGDIKDVTELEGSKSILRRMKWAFRRRAGQVDIINEHLRNCHYPIVICGDFNDTPNSYSYHTLGKGMKDAFLESGSGLGQTYYGKFPSFRIDYILHSPTIT
ncbi:MAG TPA: endonuclease/exonuclease/phosphatase family protein, partial [Bacteroidia bacterium]|nr:endonuclease/exonuclease/phosphatase family protein [Bacteroidia bacterium]